MQLAGIDWVFIFGFFAVARLTIPFTSSGISGTNSLGGGISWVTCCIATANGLPLLNGCFPVSISKKITPNE